MKRFIAALAVAVALAGCGPTKAATRDFPVGGGFDRVTNASPFDVHIRTGGAPAVHAEGPQALLDRLQVVAGNGTLTVSMRQGGWINGWNSHGVRTVVDVSLPTLRAARVSGPGDLTVDRVRTDRFAVQLDGPGDLTVASVEAHNLDVALSGPGNIRLAGRADTGRLDLSGPGDIRAGDLALRDAALTLTGPGNLTVTATGTARGSLSGPGDITVQGGARCDIRKSGPGEVHCR